MAVSLAWSRDVFASSVRYPAKPCGVLHIPADQLSTITGEEKPCLAFSL